MWFYYVLFQNKDITSIFLLLKKAGINPASIDKLWKNSKSFSNKDDKIQTLLYVLEKFSIEYDGSSKIIF